MRDIKAKNSLTGYTSPRKVKHPLVASPRLKAKKGVTKSPKAPKWKGKIPVTTVINDIEVRSPVEAVPSLLASKRLVL